MNMEITNDQLLDVIAEASYRLHSELRAADKGNRLKSYLHSIGMGDLFPEEKDDHRFESYRDGKILIIGGNEVKPQDILGALKSLGIPKEQVELCLGYDKAKKYQYSKLQYNPKYRIVLFGPIPHSVAGKGEYSSIITYLESEEGFPRIVRLTANKELKMTKSSIKFAVNEFLHTGYLAPC
ncbi:hypothetical protein IK7_05325 [Bacillus cereus VD156]|nr:MULTISPECIES: hypothetical protein [Bacillus cereus group]EJR75571.1 hypothetical protein IK7_05325 [Bacillus cereus VD156]MBJ8153917.1 hypothetical protein [Bacillus cereus]